VQPLQYLVGCAMVARGEFAFLVASQAFQLQKGDTGERMLGEDAYAMVTWGLVWALIMAPFGFRWALATYQRASPILRSLAIGGEECTGRDFVIRVIGHHHTGMLHEVLNTLHAEGLDVIEAQADISSGDMKSEDHMDRDVFIVRSRGAQKDFDDEKLHEIEHHLTELLGSETAQIKFEPLTSEITGHVAQDAQQGVKVRTKSDASVKLTPTTAKVVPMDVLAEETPLEVINEP